MEKNQLTFPLKIDLPLPDTDMEKNFENVDFHKLTLYENRIEYKGRYSSENFCENHKWKREVTDWWAIEPRSSVGNLAYNVMYLEEPEGKELYKLSISFLDGTNFKLFFSDRNEMISVFKTLHKYFYP